jgi:hypothetical protein
MKISGKLRTTLGFVILNAVKNPSPGIVLGRMILHCVQNDNWEGGALSSNRGGKDVMHPNLHGVCC